MISLRRYRIAAFAGVTMPLAALALSACVSQQAYEQQGQQLQQAQAQVAAQQAEIARLQQEIKWVVAGDMLFPDGGYRLGSQGMATLSQYVPRLQALQNAKGRRLWIPMTGRSDALQRAGIMNNLDLSSRRAGNVVAYLASQGVDPGIMSAKGFGDTHPVAQNATAEGRAQNRRVVIV